MEATFALWADFVQTVEEIRAAGPDSVIVFLHTKASGLEVDERVAHVIRLREGVPVGATVYADPAEALAAVGLSE
jgi:ketosteroid isomerase-like protein